MPNIAGLTVHSLLRNGVLLFHTAVKRIFVHKLFLRLILRNYLQRVLPSLSMYLISVEDLSVSALTNDGILSTATMDQVEAHI